MHLHHKTKVGFSLVEVLVVVVLVAVLAIIGHQSFLSLVMRGKIAEASKILDEYQNNAISIRARNGSIDPYYVLFSAGDDTGWVSGAPGGTSAVKEVDLQYVNTVTADTGTDGSGNNYVLIGVGLQDDSIIVSGADHMYVAGIEDPTTGVLTWKCGVSASKSNTVPSDYLPQNCLNTLP